MIFRQNTISIFSLSEECIDMVMYRLLCPNNVNKTPLAGQENYSTKTKTKRGFVIVM